MPCPQCGHKATKTIRWLKANDHFTCPGCGQRIDLQRDEFLGDIAKADKLLKDFARDMNRTFKIKL